MYNTDCTYKYPCPDPVNVSETSVTLENNQSALISLPTSLFGLLGVESVGVFFTFYEGPVLFPLGNGTGNEDTIVGTPVIGATVANQSLVNLLDPIVILLRLQPRGNQVGWEQTC